MIHQQGVALQLSATYRVRFVRYACFYHKIPRSAIFLRLPITIRLATTWRRSLLLHFSRGATGVRARERRDGMTSYSGTRVRGQVVSRAADFFIDVRSGMTVAQSP